MDEENVKKISDLPEADDIFEGCCMPIVQFDETKKIYYSKLRERLINDIDPFSGDYEDLTNKPTIPTKTSQLRNDSNFLTGNLNDYVKKDEYPTNIKAGAIKKGNGFDVSETGVPEAEVLSVEEYDSAEEVEFLSKGTLDNILAETPDTLFANGADYAEVGEWYDGNPNKEDRLYRFVTLKADGRKISIADSDDQIAGVTTTKAAFVGNAKNYDENDTRKIIIGIIGVVPVKTNDSTIKADDRVMSDDNGYAVKSSNNLGYRVLKVLENGLLEIVVSVNTDMIQRIKTDVNNIENNYVKNTDYATSSKGGVVKVANSYGLAMDNGTLGGSIRTLEQYNAGGDGLVISKGTLENVLNEKIGTIDTALLNLIEEAE